MPSPKMCLQFADEASAVFSSPHLGASSSMLLPAAVSKAAIVWATIIAMTTAVVASGL